MSHVAHPMSHVPRPTPSLTRLAVITTHPIQYNAPFFRAIAKNGKVDVKVFYTWDKGAGKKHDPGFGKFVEWDIPLLEGYPYTFVRNISKNPGSHRYNGIVCPSVIAEVEAYHPDAILVYGWNFHAHLQAMRHFKGKIPVWFRGDSTLLDYEVKTVKDIFKPNPENSKKLIYPFKTVIATCLRGWGYLKYSLRKIYLTHIYKSIDKAFYVGSNNKHYYLAHGLIEDQLVYMPHTVDNDFFSLNHDTRVKTAQEWRRTLGIADNDFVVLFAGKFEPKKNPKLLVKTIIEINEQTGIPCHLQIHLIMVGNGILEQELRHLTDTKTYIHFLPFQNQTNMPVVYRLGNVFCLPSISETWGLGLNEALASGSLVIASDKVGGATDLITEGVNGYIFQSNNQKELQEKIILATKLAAGESDGIIIVETIKKSFNMERNMQVLMECLFKQ